jgi:hypothetical protein
MRDITAAADDDTEMEAIEEDANIEREFTCVNDEYTRCRTGQYTKDLSRKVISDHFGRNKACTRDITDWPLFCRKHYQRATYNKALWQIRKLNLILRQFNIINRQFPGTTYDIVLKKSEESRLNEYSRKIAAGLAAADAAAAVAPRPAKHFEAPIDVLRELDQYLGRSQRCRRRYPADAPWERDRTGACHRIPATAAYRHAIAKEGIQSTDAQEGIQAADSQEGIQRFCKGQRQEDRAEGIGLHSRNTCSIIILGPWFQTASAHAVRHHSGYSALPRRFGTSR